MPRKTNRPQFNTMADVYMENARRNEEAAADRRLMNDLARDYDPNDLATYHRRGGDLKSLVVRPKPVLTPEDQELDILKQRAEESRLRRSINPTRVEPDPVTGQIFDTQVDDAGRRVMTPQVHANGAVRYRPKIEAFEGTTEEGDKWAMDRDEYGAAKDYRITKPHTDKIVKVTLADGKVVNTRRKTMPDGSFEHEEIKSTVNGKPLDFSKHERPYDHRFIKGKEKRGDDGEWKADPASFEPSEALKKSYSVFSKELNGVEQSLFQLDRDLAKTYDPTTKANIKSDIRKKLIVKKNIEAEIGRLEKAVKNEVGEAADPVLQKLRGFKGEYPEAAKTGSAPARHPKHDEAMKWLEANPNDPRADAVKKKLGL